MHFFQGALLSQKKDLGRFCFIILSGYAWIINLMCRIVLFRSVCQLDLYHHLDLPDLCGLHCVLNIFQLVYFIFCLFEKYSFEHSEKYKTEESFQAWMNLLYPTGGFLSPLSFFLEIFFTIFKYLKYFFNIYYNHRVAPLSSLEMFFLIF